MAIKIPSDIEINRWYKETSKHPEFIETLTTYQKAKLFEYCKNIHDEIFDFAIRHFGVWNETNFPKGLPEKDQLEYIVTIIRGPALYDLIKVLNALNYSWSFQERITPQKQEEQKGETSSDIELTENTLQPKKNSTNEKQLSQFQIALMCVYKNILILRPSSTETYAQELAEKNGHTSGANLYNHFTKLQGNNAQRRNQKKKPKFMLEQIEAILPYFIDSEIDERLKSDIEYFKNKLKISKEKE